MLSAIAKISAGEKDIKAHAPIQGRYGQTVSIEAGLGNGGAFADELFNDDHWGWIV
jgi:hypothetical protein